MNSSGPGATRLIESPCANRTPGSARTSSMPADCHRREKHFHLSLPGKVLVRSATAVASLKSLAGSTLEGWIPNEEQGASSKLDTKLDTVFQYDRVFILHKISRISTPDEPTNPTRSHLKRF